jgi:hypothetical protein
MFTVWTWPFANQLGAGLQGARGRGTRSVVLVGALDQKTQPSAGVLAQTAVDLFLELVGDPSDEQDHGSTG